MPSVPDEIGRCEGLSVPCAAAMSMTTKGPKGSLAQPPLASAMRVEETLDGPRLSGTSTGVVQSWSLTSALWGSPGSSSRIAAPPGSESRRLRDASCALLAPAHLDPFAGRPVVLQPGDQGLGGGAARPPKPTRVRKVDLNASRWALSAGSYPAACIFSRSQAGSGPLR